MNLVLAFFVGVATFAISQYILKLIIEPITNLKKTICGISHTLLLYREEITNAIRNESLSDKISTLSASLRSGIHLIPFYSTLEKSRIFHLPNKENITTACQQLNLLFYATRLKHDDAFKRGDIVNRNLNCLDQLSKLLNIEVTYTEDKKKTPS